MTASSLAGIVSHQITQVEALEILDSRGRPTLQVHGYPRQTAAHGSAGVPSGASTGTPGGGRAPRRRPDAATGGLGVLGAVDAVRGEIADRLAAQDWRDLAEIDPALIELDGTPDKSRLGANAIVGVSMAAPARSPQPRAAAVGLAHPGRGDAAAAGAALQRGQRRRARPEPAGLPGVHDRPARRQLVRRGGPGRRRGLRRPARPLAADGHATGLGDEGGFAPQLAAPGGRAGAAGHRDRRRRLRRRAATASRIALDPAASEFRATTAATTSPGRSLTSDEMIERYAEIIDRFPVWLHRGRPGRGRLGRLGRAHRPARRAGPAGRRRPARHQPGHHRRGHRPQARQRRADQGQPDRHRHRDPGGDAVCRRAGYAQFVSHRSGRNRATPSSPTSPSAPAAAS